MNTPGQKAARVHIFGRVQGVWFRGWTVTTAVDLDVEGWVRNRRDGSVEALFVGPPAAIATAVMSCHEGPHLARVSEVETAPAAVEPSTDFSQRPTL